MFKKLKDWWRFLGCSSYVKAIAKHMVLNPTDWVMDSSFNSFENKKHRITITRNRINSIDMNQFEISLFKKILEEQETLYNKNKLHAFLEPLMREIQQQEFNNKADKLINK